MAASSTLLLPSAAGREAPETARTSPPAPGRVAVLEVVLALAGFVALCVLVLTKAPRLLEPDDLAYRASILALSHGRLVLSTAQYQALGRQLSSTGGIAQWVHLPNGYWISEKNPGYPFFAVVFQLLGALRMAPLFYGALACVGLFAGARRWLGRYGGTFAVLLFCGSGAAITFAWRATMPTFTDASLIAAGAGALLWAVLATDAPGRRRFLAGLAAFLCLEGATFVRYTDVVELVVAVVAVLVLFRSTRLRWRWVMWWMATVGLFAAGVLGFDALVYGAPLRTGYGAGEITFSWSAVAPNLEHMPRLLVESMPMVLPAAAAALWMAARLAGSRRADADPLETFRRRRDGAVAAGLCAGWAGIWGLYLAYTWTVQQVGGDPVHAVRFYLPALGLVALLGAWLMVRLPGALSWPVVGGLLVLGVLSFHGMAAAAAVGPGFGSGGPGFGPGGGPGTGPPGGGPGAGPP